jgi:hypothetical protein
MVASSLRLPYGSMFRGWPIGMGRLSASPVGELQSPSQSASKGLIRSPSERTGHASERSFGDGSPACLALLA